MDWVRSAIAVALVGVLSGCVMVNREEQLQAAREKVWAKYGGKDGGACMQSAAAQTERQNLAAASNVPHPRGALPKAAIRDVIAAHIGEIRRCYENGILGWPDLAGKVVTKFIIDPDGSVRLAAVLSTTMRNRAVECCMLAAVRSWTFPKPENDGIVVVTYPYVLEQVPAP